MLKRKWQQRLRIATVALTYFICSVKTAVIANVEADSTTVMTVSQISAQHAMRILKNAFPKAHFQLDSTSNAIIVKASTQDIDMIRSVVAGIDVRSPLAANVTILRLMNSNPKKIAALLSPLFSTAQIAAGPNNTLLVRAQAADLTQIQTLISSLDVAPLVPNTAPMDFESVRVDYGSARLVAHKVAASYPHVRVQVADNMVLLNGTNDDVQAAKKLIAALDHTDSDISYSVIYHCHFYSADSIANLLRETYSQAKVVADSETNAIAVTATGSTQHRIADAILQLDSEGGPAGGGIAGAGSDATLDVYPLKAALPGMNNGPSSSAADLAAVVQQALSSIAPDLRITVVPTTQKLILTGSPYSIAAAKSLISKLDVAQSLVVLDTQILELDTTVASDLGISLPTPVVTSTFSETPPVPDANGVTPRLGRFQPIQRTPLSLGTQLNLLIQHGSAKVLADPRITTVSGRTATIRAGDTISVQTTAGGGAGTVATTQLQTFQTGVSLDITPVVNADNFVTVTLHPTVNSETGILNGIPQISTRDTQTTVALHENQTLVIGGLIEESDSKTINKIPVLGSLPLVGRLFQEHQINNSRNELVITVTPHILRPQASVEVADSDSPIRLPNLAPDTHIIDGVPDSAPQPQRMPRPYNVSTPPTYATAMPSVTGVVPSTTPSAPAPTPSSLASVNHYTWGTPPQNNFAKPGDPVQIDYITFSPTVAKAGDQVTFDVVTTTNVQALAVTLDSGSISLNSTSPGQWHGVITLGALDSSLPSSPSSLTLNIKATGFNGSVATVPVPISLTQ